MRGRIAWPGPALAGCEATGDSYVRPSPFAPITIVFAIRTVGDYEDLIAQTCKQPMSGIKDCKLHIANSRSQGV